MMSQTEQEFKSWMEHTLDEYYARLAWASYRFLNAYSGATVPCAELDDDTGELLLIWRNKTYTLMAPIDQCGSEYITYDLLNREADRRVDYGMGLDSLADAYSMFAKGE